MVVLLLHHGVCGPFMPGLVQYPEQREAPSPGLKKRLDGYFPHLLLIHPVSMQRDLLALRCGSETVGRQCVLPSPQAPLLFFQRQVFLHSSGWPGVCMQPIA